MNIESELHLYIEEQIKQELLNIADKCIDIYRKAILIKVYMFYQPTWYQRTNALLNSVKGEIVPDKDTFYKLRIYNDIPKETYHSTKFDYSREGLPTLWQGKDVSNFVADWVDSGHHDKTGIINQYHHYGGRRYNEYAKNLIHQLYGGLDIEIE